MGGRVAREGKDREDCCNLFKSVEINCRNCVSIRIVGVRVADSGLIRDVKSKVDSGLANRLNRLNRRSDPRVASTLESAFDSDLLINNQTSSLVVEIKQLRHLSSMAPTGCVLQ
jgi:hypothetical protein